MKSTDQATRCTSCKTVFRVVPDQLRVSEGWVRCGRCTNVFNAAENMMDMDGGWARWSDSTAGHSTAGGLAAGPPDDAPYGVDAAPAASGDGYNFNPQPVSPAAPAAPLEPSPPYRPPDSPYLTHPRSHRARQDGPVAERLASKIEAAMWRAQRPAPPAPNEPAFTAPPPTAAAPAAPSSLFDETRPESMWPQTSAMPGLEGLRAEDSGRSAAGTGALAPSAIKPGFMRQAEHNQLWQRPHRRALLLGAVAGSALLLLAQVGMAYRDLLAARQPALKPLLQAVCAGFGCKVQAARSIDSLAVESSGLVRVDKSPLYKLQVTLRNRANLELALPALDVTITDSKGDVISRKVLLPQELSSTIDKPPGDHGGTLAAGREMTLQATLQSTGAGLDAISGYTVELFYP